MTENLRKRNLYTALSLSFIAPTFLFYETDKGMEWMMWRDTPLLAVTLAAVGLTFAVLRIRTPRDQ
jgi:hypothetical protein